MLSRGDRIVGLSSDYPVSDYSSLYHTVTTLQLSQSVRGICVSPVNVDFDASQCCVPSQPVTPNEDETTDVSPPASLLCVQNIQVLSVHITHYPCVVCLFAMTLIFRLFIRESVVV